MNRSEFFMKKKNIDVKNILIVFVLFSLYSCNIIKTQEPRNDTPWTYKETVPINILPVSTKSITPPNQLLTETKTIANISPTTTLANNYIYPLIYYSNNDIFEMDIDELYNIHKNQKLLSNVTNEMELIPSILFSPDGTKLLLDIDIIRQGTHLDIYDIKSGKKIESLGNPNLYSVEPAWSNDGIFIAYSNYNPDSVIRIDPTNECLGNNCLIKYFRRQNADEYGDLTDPMWTKDNQEIVFLFHKGQKAELCIGFIEKLNYKCPVNDKYIIQYSINNDNQIIFDDFTEDGRSIYYFDLNKYLLDGESDILKLSPDIASFYYPIFSKNGELLFYISENKYIRSIFY